MFARNPAKDGLLDFVRVFALVSVLALIAACGGGSSNGGDDDEEDDPDDEDVGDDTTEFIDSATVSSHGEFQVALDDAAGYTRDDLDNPDEEAYLIEVVDDIEDGFEEAGQLEYSSLVNLHIRGTSADTTIDAGGHSRILAIDTIPGATVARVTIEDLHFTGGFGDEDGGRGAAIQSDHDLVIIDSDFSDNVTEDRGGGAISASKGLHVEDSSFTNNSAAGSGGAIQGFDDEEEQKILNSTFTDNSGYSGGAIRSYRLVIRESEFSGNETTRDSSHSFSSGRGGAVHAQETASNDLATLEVEDSTFTANEAEQGGAIWINSSETVHVRNSTFESNEIDWRGGAIAADLNEGVVVEDSLFEDNGAEGGSVAGSAIWNWNGDITSANSTYTDNREKPVLDADDQLIDEGGNEFEPSDHEPDWDVQ